MAATRNRSPYTTTMYGNYLTMIIYHSQNNMVFTHLYQAFHSRSHGDKIWVGPWYEVNFLRIDILPCVLH